MEMNKQAQSIAKTCFDSEIKRAKMARNFEIFNFNFIGINCASEQWKASIGPQSGEENLGEC